MNIADHALRAVTEAPVGLTRLSRSNPKKAVKKKLEQNIDAITEWINNGHTVSMIASTLDVSNTSFWQHIVVVASEELILELRANGQLSNKDNNYKANLRS